MRTIDLSRKTSRSGRKYHKPNYSSSRCSLQLTGETQHAIIATTPAISRGISTRIPHGQCRTSNLLVPPRRTKSTRTKVKGSKTIARPSHLHVRTWRNLGGNETPQTVPCLDTQTLAKATPGARSDPTEICPRFFCLYTFAGSLADSYFRTDSSGNINPDVGALVLRLTEYASISPPTDNAAQAHRTRRHWAPRTRRANRERFDDHGPYPTTRTTAPSQA